ncbi:hypothetical protein TARUN_5798 [Trichoderma arundinaceum]|uniref:Uncharacterized protein n=1 Tax=Trichoderma arundinaceum TaxID=490622 RepID=A0A395NJZ9_TRIAR|nr:hypothetical protein TARUN_5798 [Trichoderma arundinaceum]
MSTAGRDAIPDGFEPDGKALSEVDKERLDNSLRELQEFKFLARYGDIAGLVWNDLKVADARLRISSDSGKVSLPRTAIEIIQMIREEQGLAEGFPVWPEFSDARREMGPYGDQLIALASHLVDRMDIETVVFAVEVYASRNQICHWARPDLKAEGLDKSEAAKLFVQALDKDRADLESELPDNWSDHKGKWDILIDHFQSSRVQKSGEGLWEAKDTGSGAVRSRAVREASRSLTDYGTFRELHVSAQHTLFDWRLFSAEPEIRHPSAAEFAKRGRSFSDPFQYMPGTLGAPMDVTGPISTKRESPDDATGEASGSAAKTPTSGEREMQARLNLAKHFLDERTKIASKCKGDSEEVKSRFAIFLTDALAKLKQGAARLRHKALKARD